MQEEAAAEAVATKAEEAEVSPKVIEDIPSLPPPEEHVLNVFDYGPKGAADQMATTWEQINIMLAQSLVRRSPTP
jgi:hypothetical protein